jgi:heat shock protein HslJ
MSSNDFDPDDRTQARRRASFGDIDAEDAKVNSRAALTAPRPDRSSWTRPAALAGAAAAVLLLLFGLYEFRGDQDTANTATDSTPEASGSLQGIPWTLVRGTGPGGAVPVVDDWPITITFDDDSVGGRAACNSYGGTYQLTDGDLSIGELSATAMGCEPAPMEAESAFLGALPAVSRLDVSATSLVLSGEGVELHFARDEPLDQLAVVDTLWLLDTLIQGEVASTVSGDPATLLLRADGTFEAGTGCRTLAGSYITNGNRIVFTTFGATGECPPELTRQDSDIVSVLESGFTATIDANRLTLMAPGGEGLSYQ